MKLAVIGATGPTGQQIVFEALEQGHEVVVVARSPEKLTTTHEKLKVLKADLTDVPQLVEAFRGCDAVLSAIGGRAGLFAPCDVYTSTGKAAIAAMRELGLTRFVCVTSWGTKDTPGLPFLWRYVFKPIFVRNVVQNMDDFEEYLLSDCSDINYTVVRPPRLLNAPPSSKPLLIGEGQLVEGYDLAQISRRDVAKFMLTCLGTPDYHRKMVAITSQRE